MTYPTPGLTALVRDGACGLLKLNPAGPDADRVATLAVTVLDLITHHLGQTTTYDPVYVAGMPYDETTIPPPVLEAAVVATAEMYRRKDAPFGVLGAWSQDGESIRVSGDPLAGVRHLLAPYRLAWGLA